MTPATWTVTEWAVVAGIFGGIITAIAGAFAWLVKMHMDKRREDVEERKSDAETENTYAETIATLRTTVNELVKSVDDLRRRVYALEAERDQNKRTINALRDWARRVLAWLKAQNMTGYPEPDTNLLDTDPNMRAVGK